MKQQRRYQLRPGAVALTRPAWAFVICAGLVGVLGVALLFTDALLGALLVGVAGGAIGLTVATRGRFDRLDK